MSTNTTNIDNGKINELINSGFKLINGTDFFYIDINGNVFNAKRQTTIRPYKNKKGYYLISLNSEVYNLAKLIINHFSSDENKTDYIRFKDGNKENLTLSNIEYCTLSDLQKGIKRQSKPTNETPKPKRQVVNAAMLYSYYSIFDEKSLRTLLSSPQIKKEIESEILNQRNEYQSKYLQMVLFIDFANGKNIETICRQYEITENHAKTLIRDARNKLYTDIQTDIENGLLPKYKHELTKRQTKTEIIKEINKTYKIKIPLKKKSAKETLNKYLKRLEMLKKQNTNSNEKK